MLDTLIIVTPFLALLVAVAVAVLAVYVRHLRNAIDDLTRYTNYLHREHMAAYHRSPRPTP